MILPVEMLPYSDSTYEEFYTVYKIKHPLISFKSFRSGNKAQLRELHFYFEANIVSI